MATGNCKSCGQLQYFAEEAQGLALDVSLNMCLFLSTSQLFTLTYRVFDGQESNETTVLINVESVNLFPPKFDQIIYDASTTITEEEYTDPVLIATVSFNLN